MCVCHFSINMPVYKKTSDKTAVSKALRHAINPQILGWRQAHPIDQYDRCPECRRTFRQLNGLRIQIQVDHHPKPFVELCEQFAEKHNKTWAELRRKIIYHKPIERWVCIDFNLSQDFETMHWYLAEYRY